MTIQKFKKGKKNNVAVTWVKAVERLEKTYRKLSPKTVQMYQNSLNHLTPLFGDLELIDISEDHLEKYKDFRMCASISGATFNRERSTLKRLFTLNGIPWNFRKDVFESEPEKARDRFLDDSERGRLIDACKKRPYLYTAILVGLNTGLRKTALLTLQWADVNFKDNVISKEGKGGKISRIPMTQGLRHHLQGYRIKQGLKSSYLFPSPSDVRRPMSDIRKSFATACKEANVRGVRFHDLRRSFGTNLAMATKDLMLVQEMLGHADISTTRKHYAHLTDDHKRDGIEVFEKATN
jgi:integrase